MPDVHALLSPSSAHRWLNCTAAPRLEEHIQDRGSDYAREGSLAHAYCARHLKRFLGQNTQAEDDEIALLDDEYHTGEMDEYTETYKSIVLEEYSKAKAVTDDALLLVERRLDFSQYIPDAFGTSDAIIVGDGTMTVIDFKYGKGVTVSAENNPQMMIYGLGAYLQYSFDFRIDTLSLMIIQPRVGNYSTWSISVRDLLFWADNTLRPKAREAFSGKGEQHAGDWCQFCKVKHRCRKLKEDCVGAFEAHHDHEVLSLDEVAAILPLLPQIKMWMAGIEEHALQAALEGQTVKGYKVVHGKSNRRISDPDAVISALEAGGYASDAIMRPRELKTITDLERLCGKKTFATLCGDYIEKPEGKPTLVPESDKREAINPALDDFKDL